MSLSDILVHVDPGHDCTRPVEAAARIAAEQNAHVTGLCACAEPDFMAHPVAPIPVMAMESQRRALEKRIRACQSQFTTITQRHGIQTEWRVEKGEPVATLVRHARYTDLVVLARPVKSDLAFVEESVAVSVCLRSARPVLVVPDVALPAHIGEKIIVGWNGSREAVRAIADAMPFLKRATDVSVVAINAEKQAGPVPAMDICQHLARHGVTAKATPVHTDEIGVSEMLLTLVADERADLLVMGAYGHSRMRELILGGVTRYVLEHMRVPVLISH